MTVPTIPASFWEIAKLSSKYRAQDNDSAGLDYPAQNGHNVSAVAKQLHAALEELDDDTLKQLIGWLWLGRDYADSTNPNADLETSISAAWVNRRDDAIVYIMGKPIEEYLQTAQKLMLNAK